MGVRKSVIRDGSPRRGGAGCPRSRGAASRSGRARGGNACRPSMAIRVQGCIGSGAPCSTSTRSCAPGGTACAPTSATRALFDAHTHIGDSDPDGARQTPEQLLAALEPVAARAVVFADARARRLPGRQRPRAPGGGGLRRPARRLLPARPARRPADRGAPLPRRRREGHQAAPARRALHALRAGGAGDRRARARAPRPGPDPRRPRHPGARPGHRPAVRRVHRRAADPRPRRHLRHGLAVARAARAPEPVRRHRLVGPGGHARHVRALSARQPAVAATRPTGGRWSPPCCTCASRSRRG